mgnify:CR=1 FL=1
MAELIIFRGEPATAIATVSIDEKTVYTQKVMEVEVIEAHFITAAAIPIQIGDYVVFNGKKFYLNYVPSITKKNLKTNQYKAYFHGVLYDLHKKLFISSDGLSDFTEVGSVSLFLQLIVDSVNTITSGWQVGTVDASEDILLDFVNETCLDALNKVASSFKYEFEVIGKTINFKKVIGTPKNLTFEYGRNKGLYAIDRKQVDSKALFTRVYGFGGSKNIAYDYRNRAKRLVFEERKLEKNTNIFGIREANFTDDTIYPKRTADLTNVDIIIESGAFNATTSWIEDTTLDFDINDFLLEGQAAKIVFKSGDLQGVEFEIWKVDFNLKRLYIKPFQDTDDYVLPNQAKQPRLGDSYTLVDLKMPPSYVIQAETDLKAATQQFIDANAVPKTLYLVKVDPKFSKTNNVVLSAGDLVKVVDITLGVNRAIRIQQLSYPIVNSNKIEALIADYIPYELQDYANRTSIKTSKVFQSISNKITKIENIQKTTNVTNNYSSTGTTNASAGIIINSRKFNLVKAFDNNTNLEVLEVGDIIFGNWWDRFTYVKAWRYTGGNKSFKSSWNEAEAIDFTPYDEEGNSFPEELQPLEFIVIRGRYFKLIKGFNNENIEVLEVGDIIADNWWSANEFLQEAIYIGGSINEASSWKFLGLIETN